MIDRLKNIIINIKDRYIALSKKQRYIIIFCSIIFICFILMLLISAVDSAVNKNYFFVGSSIFFQDVGNVFMDFFNVNYFVQDMDPYIGSGSSYPPMVLLFAKIFQLIQGAVESTEYIQLSARGIISCVIYYGIFLVCAWLMFRAYMKRQGVSLKLSVMLFAALGLTAPMLFALDRGNYLLYTFLFVGFFLLNFRSEKRWQRELSYISLALAVSFKLYPAIFALLMLNKNEWREVIKTAVYSVVLLVVPMFAFNGGFMVNFEYFVSNLLTFSSQEEGYFDDAIYYLNGYYNSVSLYGVFKIFCSLVSGTAMVDLPSYTGMIGNALALLLALAAITSFFFAKEKWVKVFLLTSIMTFVLSTNYEYNLIFFIFPLLMFLTDGEAAEEGKALSKKSKMYFIACGVLLTLIFIPLPLGYLVPKKSHSLEHGYPVLNFVQFLSYIALTIVLIVQSFGAAREKWRERKRLKEQNQSGLSEVEEGAA